MTPRRVQRRRSKGWKMPDGTRYVGRGTKFGNPFRINAARSREECIAQYRDWLLARYALEGPGLPPTRDEIAALRGRHLSCWCALDQLCHADVLLELANALDAVDPARHSGTEGPTRVSSSDASNRAALQAREAQ